MLGLVNYSDSDEDTENCFQKNIRKAFKRKELDDITDTSLTSLTKENIRKLPKIDKEYDFDETEKPYISDDKIKEPVTLSSLLQTPKNVLKTFRLSKDGETKKSDIKYTYVPQSVMKNKINKKDVEMDGKQQDISLFSLDIEKPDIKEFEQQKSDSSFYVPMLVKKSTFLDSKNNDNDCDVKLSEKNQPIVHCSEIYRVDNDQDFSDYTYLLPQEEKEVLRKEKDIESIRIYGKRRSGQGPINFLEVDAEQEYNTNEMMKRQGLLVEAPQPIRAIGSGRHQITTLLNSAISQRERFEEAFAANKETKRQSGKKYGF